MSSDLLTHSRLATLRQCPRKHYLRYEVGLTRDMQADYFRLGSAFHRGLELRKTGSPADEAVGGAVATYETTPEGIDAYAWAIEREKVIQLLAGHFWRYERDDIEIVAVEQQFEFPLRNPDTGAMSRTFQLAGKIDVIVKLPDRRLAVLEYKTVGEDIGAESDYWLRLRGDAQISMYVLAARALGHPVATVIYDATRKPTIQPHQIPLLDIDGLKVVLDADGQRVMTKQGKPRQTGDTAAGYVLQTRPETPEEYGARLLADIGERPDYYYQRREVPRLDGDLDEFADELWQQSKQLLETRNKGRWFRNVTRQNCTYCEFAGLCLNNTTIDPAAPPSGFRVTDNVHPELTGDTE